MNARRLTLALFVSLTISAFFTYWLSRHVKPVHGAVAPKRWVVAASKPLEAGELLKPASLRLVEWPVALPGSFANIRDLSGRIMLYPVTSDQPILAMHLAPPGVSAGLAAKIPAGMRAISVRSDEVVGVAGFLLPGTHVDVLLTYRTDRTSSDAKTTTVLQDVVVLAAGQQIRPDPEGKPASVTNLVTLLLRPEDSEKLVLATSLGAIHFVLRNGSDEEKSPYSSVGLNELAGNPNAAGDQLTAARSLVPRKPYQVETVLGDKRVVKTFN